MKIELKEITVRELANGYEDNDEEGVFGYGGKLDIRPPYQRNFIYKPKERDAVIATITKDYPLNVMYWAVRNDGSFEVMDGQQRTISICEYISNNFSINIRGNNLAFDNLQDDEKEKINNYKLMVYLCSGTPTETLEWFKTINIAGLKLTDQELRNAVYSGPWVTDAKRWFSKRECPASKMGDKYLTGSANRQEFLETAIKWISNGDIEGHMATHQHDQNASALWRYFQDVISWVTTTFTTYRKEMKGVDWGTLYNKYKNVFYNTEELEAKICRLIDDDDVENVKGIYPYILTGEEKYLNLRQFDDKIKRKVYERQKGVCPKCEVDKNYEIEEMEADHITPWHEGGKTIAENCQLLCKYHNRIKSGK